MKLTDVVDSIHKITQGDYYNHQKFSKRWLENYIAKMTRRVGEDFIFEAALPDGWFYISVMQYSEGEYTYYIPETKAQSAELGNRLFSR